MYKKLIVISIMFSFFWGTVASAYGPSNTLLAQQFENLVAQNGLQKSMQSACIDTQSGRALSYNSDMKITPASVSKLYTFDFALSKLSPNYRYVTTFYLDGMTLYINGGGDPHFVIEHLHKVIDQIYAEKNIRINKIVFSPNFYFNWKSKPEEIQKSILLSIKGNLTIPVAPDLKIIPATQAYMGKGEKYGFQSAPLHVLLKQINNYSTNISADVLFNRLGGPNAFSKYMEKSYGVGSDTIRFETGSGLSGNYTTCALTLRVIKHLEQTLKEKGLALSDVMSVPTIDPGVLQKRAIYPQNAGAMIAKSGYVNNHHALAGVMNTSSGPAYFAIFTYFDSEKKNTSTKSMIDMFVNTIAEHYKKSLVSFNYRPNPLQFQDVRVVKI